MDMAVTKCVSTLSAPFPDDLPDKRRWHKLRAIGMAINNTVRDGQECIEFRYYILSTFPSGLPLCRGGTKPLVD